MANKPLFVDVILPLAVRGCYTYRIPEPWQASSLQAGCRVTVPFGPRKIFTAVIRRMHSRQPHVRETKDIISLLDENPVVSEWQMRLWDWMSSYYMCTPGEVYHAALPAALKLESETVVRAILKPDAKDELTASEQHLMERLAGSEGLTILELQRKSGRKDIMPAIRRLTERRLIELEERIGERYKPRTIRCIRLSDRWSGTEQISELRAKLSRSKAKLRILNSFLDLVREREERTDLTAEDMSWQTVIEKAQTGGSVLQAMVREGVFETFNSTVPRLPVLQEGSRMPVHLSSMQQEALDNLHSQLAAHQVVLLHGVTSSGKTEIYMHLIQEYLLRGMQVLYLLPEIALTVQMTRRLQQVFGGQVAVYHSKFPDSERYEIWKRLMEQETGKEGGLNIVLGARSAVFLPFKALGLIIVDEEHENSYKQHNPAPRYHARDSAIMLARLCNAKVILGTATPCIETYYNCKTGKYGLVEMRDRYLNLELPEVRVVDVRKARKQKAMHASFSSLLVSSIDDALKNGEQVILFQNRRGFSLYTECHECGWVPRCRHCDVSLIYHKNSNRLRCHYCGYSAPMSRICPQCGTETLRMHGFGTERLEEEASLLFPGARLARLDLDTTRSRKSYEDLLERFEKHETDILVGTQMVSKGLDFNNVRVVGIMDADAMMNFPDFRSYERSFQLMSQVSGRAGRKQGRGLVIIQTSDAGHPVIGAVVRNDYLSLYSTQLEERRQFGYPPFCRLMEITLKHAKKDLVDEVSLKLAESLHLLPGCRVMGPEYPLVSRVSGQYLKNILIKIEKGSGLEATKAKIGEKIAAITDKKAWQPVRIIINVDP